MLPMQWRIRPHHQSQIRTRVFRQERFYQAADEPRSGTQIQSHILIDPIIRGMTAEFLWCVIQFQIRSGYFYANRVRLAVPQPI